MEKKCSLFALLIVCFLLNACGPASQSTSSTTHYSVNQAEIAVQPIDKAMTKQQAVNQLYDVIRRIYGVGGDLIWTGKKNSSKYQIKPEALYVTYFGYISDETVTYQYGRPNMRLESVSNGRDVYHVTINPTAGQGGFAFFMSRGVGDSRVLKPLVVEFYQLIEVLAQ